MNIHPPNLILRQNNPIRFRQTNAMSRLRFSGEKPSPLGCPPPKKYQYIANSKRLDRILLFLANLADTMGWQKIARWLHEKRFPHWKAMLQWAQANPLLTTPAGGIALLPHKPNEDTTEGLLVIDGVPRMTEGRERTPDDMSIMGSVLWVNTQNLQNCPLPDKDYHVPVGLDMREKFIQHFVQRISPQEAKRLLDSQMSYVIGNKHRGLEHYCFQMELCQKVAQVPDLKPKIDPMWMVPHLGDRDYFSKEDGLFQLWEDRDLLASMGYVDVLIGFRHFGVPTQYEVRKKLEAEGKIPEWKAVDRVDFKGGR
jgi:hypothetical protein